MDVSSAQGGAGRFYHGGVAQLGVVVAGGKGRWDGVTDPGAGDRCAGESHLPVILGAHFAADVDLGAGHVCVELDTAGHDHHPGGVNNLSPWNISDNAAILYTDVLHFPIYAIGGVVHFAVNDPHHDFNSFTRVSNLLSTSSSEG